MGGYGSGRRWSSSDTTDEYLRMDVRYMQRRGFLRENVSGSLHWSSRGERIGTIGFRTEAERVVLSYRHRERGAEYESLEYPISLERTPCNFGGSRPWFLCPARGCGRRTATLYGGRIYACRKCYRLAYLSQRQSRTDRASDRAELLLKKLGWADLCTVMEPAPPRRKGMHEKTYKRLAAEYEAARYEMFFYGPAGAMAFYEAPFSLFASCSEASV